MKFTLDVFLSKTKTSTPTFNSPQGYSRVQLWQRKLNQPRSIKFTPKTFLHRACVTPVRLQPSALPALSNYRNILMLSTKAPSLSTFTRSVTPLFITKGQWATFIWRLYRRHFLKINILSVPHIFNLVNYFTLGGVNFVGRNTRKRSMVRGLTTFQTHNI